MSRYFTIVVVLLFHSFSASGQLIMYLNDEFNDNSLRWLVEETSTYATHIANGKFVFTKNSEHGRLVTQHQFIETDKEFSLEAEFVKETLHGNMGYGLVWGHCHILNKGNWFLVSDNSFSIQTQENHRKDIGHWIESTAINPPGQVNSLKVAQREDSTIFYVNGKEVTKIPALPLHDTHFGMITFVNGKVTVDNLVLKSATKINLANDDHHGLVKENLGESVNSQYAEVHPHISADGRHLYYGRKSSPENVGGEKDLQDIWLATSPDGITWNRSVNVGNQINTPTGDNLVSVSPDNNTMTFFYYQSNHKLFGVTTRTETGWSPLKPLPIEIGNESIYLESCVSPDGKALLFTAKNPGNLYYHAKREERDIFVCLKQKSNQWTAPINLGPVVNTMGNEYSPFIAADGRTLYFATDGLPGYGNVDIFMTQRLDDTWTNWTTPINLGPEINTPHFDAYYTIPASGHAAYMVSSHNSLGITDIVRVRIPEAIQPDPVVLVSGVTLNAKTKQPVSADILIDDLGSQQHIGEALSNIKTGEYRIVLPYGRNYGFHASAKGYLSVNENMELAEFKEYTELNKDLYLVPLKAGETIPLNNVFFVRGKSEIRPESFPELDRLIQIMNENPTMEINLAGHTDNLGYRPRLIMLSKERVGAVKDYLVKNGIASNRIEGKGYGPNKPLVKNDTEENRMKNRRVEFKIKKI